MTRFGSGWADDGVPRSQMLRRAGQVLELGLSGKQRPIDELIRRLRRPGGRMWLLEAVKRCNPPDGVDPAISGQWNCEQLTSLKERSKTWLAEAGTLDDAAVALAIYCCCIAGAAVHHRRLISSQSPEQWQFFLTDLAEAAPEAWQAFLLNAAVAIGEIDEPSDGRYS